MHLVIILLMFAVNFQFHLKSDHTFLSFTALCIVLPAYTKHTFQILLLHDIQCSYWAQLIITVDLENFTAD